MMRKTVYILIGIALLLGCRQSKPETEPSAVEIQEKTVYTQDQFRRFTYFFSSSDKELKKFFQSEKWVWQKKKWQSDEILDFKIYNNGTSYFIIIDTSPELNSASLFKVLQKEPVFQMLNGAVATENTSFPVHDAALERIYKLEQKAEYTPTEGQLKTSIGAHKRFVWTLLLEEDSELMAEYRKVHSIGMAWPEITANMKSIGVKDMEIYLHGTQAILIMDTVPDFDLEEVAPRWQQLPREQEWQEYVAKFQRTDTDSSIREKWKDMLEL